MKWEYRKRDAHIEGEPETDADTEKVYNVAIKFTPTKWWMIRPSIFHFRVYIHFLKIPKD